MSDNTTSFVISKIAINIKRNDKRCSNKDPTSLVEAIGKCRASCETPCVLSNHV